LRRIAGMMTGDDTRYEMPGAPPHPLLGRFAPDLPLVTAGGPTRVAELMHAARPVLLDLTATPSVRETAAPWKDRVDVIPAHHPAPPGSGGAGFDALLIRPDGYVAWVGTEGAAERGLCEALSHWFGGPE
jgi:hypothetical protein